MRKIIITAVCFMLVLAGVGTGHADMLQIKGSDTLINMVQRMSEVYMEKNPGKYIAVTGGGSGTGIAALINGKCDIANASRLMKDKEVAQAQGQGITPKRVVVALDGITFIVNPDNPLNKLTVEELGRIYRGEVTNWSEVGGADMPITLYGRQSNSGTFAFVQESVCKGDYAGTMRRMNGNSQIVEAVKSDPSSIGYVGVGYAKEATGIQALKVAARSGAPYANPLNSEDVATGNYPVTRPLNQYLNGQPAGAVKEFIEFELSSKGQDIVEEMGFLPIPDEYEEYNAQLGF